jgi:hypothetical protein
MMLEILRIAPSSWQVLRGLWLAILLALPAALQVAPAAAQALPWRRAPIIEPHQVLAPPPAASAPPTVERVVQIFHDACVVHEGQPTAVIDWALNQGFEPLNPLQADASELLGGVDGTALAAPGSAGLVVLAAAQDGRCVLWAEKMNGPRLRTAFHAMVDSLAAQGARLQAVIARNLESGRAWRHQSQWRYRQVGAERDFGLGSATTLAEAPGAQLLHFGPIEPSAARDPDGLPRQ